jgi:hypothetical protein
METPGPVNGPFFFNGHYHIFMQQSFPWVKGWNGAIGWGHMVSKDLARWKEISSFTGFVDAFVPGIYARPSLRHADTFNSECVSYRRGVYVYAISPPQAGGMTNITGFQPAATTPALSRS